MVLSPRMGGIGFSSCGLSRPPYFFILILISFYFLPASCQTFYDSTKITTVGGMRISRRDQDAIRMYSMSTSGLRSAGSAALAGGSIKVGSAASEVISELNPVSINDNGIQGDLFKAGDESLWSMTHQLQRPTPTGYDEIISRRISKGVIDPRLLEQLRILQPSIDAEENLLVQADLIRNSNGEYLSRKLKFTKNYDNLQLLTAAKDGQGSHLTRGTHIISFTPEAAQSTQTPRFNFNRQAQQPAQVWVASTGTDSKQIAMSPVYIGYANSFDPANSVKLNNLQSAGASLSDLRYTILGFSKNPNPNDGKKSTLFAFATNNRSVGAVNARPGQTLADLAAIYGTSIESLMNANNLPSSDVDISNLSLVVPADLSTIGFEDSIEGETVSMAAKRFEVDVAWLLELNDLSDPGLVLPTGSKLRIPGRRPLGSPILPPAKPMPPDLEYADYGAYTTYEVTYHIRGSLVPLFAKTLIDSFR